MFFLSLFFQLNLASAAISPEDIAAYRQLTMKIRSEASFEVPAIGTKHRFEYKFEFAEPIYPEPIAHEYLIAERTYRNFWDRIFLKDGSRLIVNDEEIPLTCIFVSGQDNRFNGLADPRFPEFIMRIYLVANDYTCTGPINPSWPANGGKKEMWDTYVHYEVKDPTIMLPMEPMIRYRWNEFKAIWVK